WSVGPPREVLSQPDGGFDGGSLPLRRRVALGPLREVFHPPGAARCERDDRPERQLLQVLDREVWWFHETPRRVMDRSSFNVAPRLLCGVVGRELDRHPTGHGFAPQISAAYSAMVRSLENWPECATLRIAFRAQASGCRKSAPTCSCAFT